MLCCAGLIYLRQPSPFCQLPPSRPMPPRGIYLRHCLLLFLLPTKLPAMMLTFHCCCLQIPCCHRARTAIPGRLGCCRRHCQAAGTEHQRVRHLVCSQAGWVCSRKLLECEQTNLYRASPNSSKMNNFCSSRILCGCLILSAHSACGLGRKTICYHESEQSCVSAAS